MLRIKAERLRRGWTQTELGYHARLASADVSRIESGRLVPYPAQAARLARVLGMNENELLERTSEPQHAV